MLHAVRCRLVQEVAALARYDPPAHVMVIPSKEMNAFAAGFRKSGRCVAVTSGLRDGLTERELKAVIAHEMGHLLARDTTKNMHMSVAVAGLGGIYSAGRALLESSRSIQRDKEKDGINLTGSLGLGLMAAGLCSQLAAHLLRLGTSRRHEFTADAVASELYGAEAIISALKKIHSSASRGVRRDALYARGGAFAHMYISNPGPHVALIQGMVESKVTWVQKALRFLSTHPSLDERVDSIRKRSRRA